MFVRGRLLSGVALTIVCLVFIHQCVEHPVPAVPDRPVGADDAAEALDGELGAERAVAGVDARRAAGNMPLGDHLADD